MLEEEKIKLALKKIAEFEIETGHTVFKTKDYFDTAFKRIERGK